MVERNNDAASASLTDKIGGAVGAKIAEMRANRAGADAVAALHGWDGHIASLPLLVNLETLSGLCGKPANRDLLSATLPTYHGEMDARFAPLAMARAGIDARWEKRSLASLMPHELPVLVQMREGGSVLITALAVEGALTVRDATGEQVVPVAVLDAMTSGEILVSGHVDPENGLDLDEERSLIRRNPRLWLVGTFMTERKRLMQLLGAAALLNLCGLAIPLYMRAIYDRVVPNLAIESLWALSIGIAIVLVFEATFKHVRGSYVDAIGVRVGQAVQHRAMTSFLNARLGKAEHNVGSLTNALRDTEALALLVPQAVATLCVDLPYFFGYLALITLIGGWVMAGPVVGAIGLVLVGALTSYGMKLTSKRVSKLMQARSNLVVDVTEGLATIKANQAEGKFLRQWDIVSDHIGIGTKTARKWNDMPGSASGFLVQLVTVLVVIIGVFQIKAGAMTTGALVAVVMLTGRAMVPVSATVSMVTKLYQSMSQFAGLAHVLALEPERDVSDPSVQRKVFAGDIRVQSLDHVYAQNAAHSLKDISLTIKPGEKIALIGRSGSGKSTLLQLLSGMIEPQSGAITVDGHAMNQYAASQLRQAIVYAAQDAALFDTSIWDNILLGLEEPAPELVEMAIGASGLDRFVSRTVEGYGKKIGSRGCKLSGGQRQSLILARALVRDPKVLLLDEPTASMDINSEQAVIHGLADAVKGRTLIVATHRMALLDLVDRVIWLDEGRIVADKPKTEILNMLRNQHQASAAAQAA